jgi:hypothetical protein
MLCLGVLGYAWLQREPVTVEPVTPQPVAQPQESLRSISVFGATPTAQRGNLRGGKPFRDACPPGEGLVGARYSIERRGWLGQIGAICGRIEVSSASPAAFTVGAPRELPIRGLADGAVRSSLCPTNQVVVGFDGRTGLLVDRLALRCAPLIASAGDPSIVSLGRIITQPPFGGTGGKPFPTTDCPRGQIANVANVRAGDDVDAFGLVCGSPTIAGAQASPSTSEPPIQQSGPKPSDSKTPPAPATTTLPNLRGLELAAAGEVLRKLGLAVGKVSSVPADGARPGTVIRQSGGPGQQLAPGSTIDLEVAEALILVPNVVGRDERDAWQILEKVGLAVRVQPTYDPTSRRAGSVVEQQPAAGTRVKARSRVTLIVAKPLFEQTPPQQPTKKEVPLK